MVAVRATQRLAQSCCRALSLAGRVEDERECCGAVLAARYASDLSAYTQLQFALVLLSLFHDLTVVDGGIANSAMNHF